MFSVGMGANAATQATIGKVQPTLKDEARKIVNTYLNHRCKCDGTGHFRDRLQQLDTRLVQAVVKELEFRMQVGAGDMGRLKRFHAIARAELNQRIF